MHLSTGLVGNRATGGAGVTGFSSDCSGPAGLDGPVWSVALESWLADEEELEDEDDVEPVPHGLLPSPPEEPPVPP